MKALYLVLFALLLSLYNSRDCNDLAEKASECHDATVPSGYYKCCYVTLKLKKKGSSSETYRCGLVDEKTYNDIKKYVEEAEKRYKDEKYDDVTVKIDCDSKYIIYSLLSLILLFL